MQKVLLAIDGIKPDKKIFSYAVELCKRIKAELDVLLIIPDRVRKKAVKFGKCFEKSMMAAAFAESGDFKTAREMESEAMENIGSLLATTENEGLKYGLTLKTGETGGEIIEYVNSDRNVVITILDPSPGAQETECEDQSESKLIGEIKHKLSTPLVVVRN